MPMDNVDRAPPIWFKEVHLITMLYMEDASTTRHLTLIYMAFSSAPKVDFNVI